MSLVLGDWIMVTLKAAPGAVVGLEKHWDAVTNIPGGLWWEVGGLSGL